MKQKQSREINVKRMGNDKFEIEISSKAGSLFGLAKKNRESGQWDISPNVQKYSEDIQKAISENI